MVKQIKFDNSNYFSVIVPDVFGDVLKDVGLVVVVGVTLGV